MRLFRLILLCVLSLTIPLQGIAGVPMAASPCPMEQEMMAMSADMGHEAAMEQDCCNDADTFAKTGKMCKTGQDCQVLSQFPAFARPSFPLLTADIPHYSSIVLSVRSFDASSVWRPPTRA